MAPAAVGDATRSPHGSETPAPSKVVRWRWSDEGVKVYLSAMSIESRSYLKVPLVETGRHGADPSTWPENR